MGCKFFCDGCGEEQEVKTCFGGWHKPNNWFEREDEDGVQVACSRKCIEKISEKTGKTGVVLPL